MANFRILLYPLSLVYNAITSLRNGLYNLGILKSQHYTIPVIVVGNLSVGGTGKTPQIEYLIRLLQPKYQIAVLSRGYKRKSKGFLIGNENANAEMIGDEPFQYYKKFKNIIVCVDTDRRNGISQLLKLNSQPDVILLDDAFQHRRVKAGLNILLTSYGSLYSNDFVLPAGNLRENRLGAKRAQIVIVTKCPNELSEKEQFKIAKELQVSNHQTVFFSTIKYNLELKGTNSVNLQTFKNGEILLVTGIANPKPLTSFLKREGIKFTHLEFPDHHSFTNKDVELIKNAFAKIVTKNKTVLTTEKDYVRIFAKLEKLHFIEIQTKFVSNEADFDYLINAYVEQSSRNS